MILREFDGGILYSLLENNSNMVVASGILYEILDRSATEILELCDGSNTISTITNIMISKYNIEYSEGFEIVEKFLEISV